MMAIDDLLATISALQRADLERWIREELVVEQDRGSLTFSDMGCARIRLICTLTYDLDVDDSTLPIVLSLLDQLYDTRQRLFSLTRAIKAQDETVQLAIAAATLPESKLEV